MLPVRPSAGTACVFFGCWDWVLQQKTGKDFLKSEGFGPFGFKHAFWKTKKKKYINKWIITAILNNQYRNSRGTGLNMIPKFQYPVIQMADNLGTYWTTPKLSKGDSDPPDVTATWLKDGMKLIPGCLCYQSCLTFLGDSIRPLHWWIASPSMALLLLMWWETNLENDSNY